MQFLRFLIVGPFTFIALASFALYFGTRNAGYFQKGLPQIFWGATAGRYLSSTKRNEGSTKFGQKPTIRDMAKVVDDRLGRTTGGLKPNGAKASITWKF